MMTIKKRVQLIIGGCIILLGLLSFWAFSITYAPMGVCLNEKGELIAKNVSENISELFKLVRNNEVGIKVKVGSFTCPAATGNYTVTGVGFQSRCIDFSVGRVSTGNAELGFGFVDYNMNQRATSVRSTEPSDMGGRVSVTQAILLTDAAGVVMIGGTVTSINSDGCVINFTAVNSAFTIIYKAMR